MDTVEDVWQQIENWMAQNAPHLLQQLALGADEEAIKSLEDNLDITLPDDMRASYRRHDGGLPNQAGGLAYGHHARE